jgi:predicted MPP superfamily phosphohydrolase
VRDAIGEPIERKERADAPISPRGIDRRRFAIGAMLGGFSAVGLTGATVYEAFAANPYEPRLERITVPVPPDHPDLAGLTIGFVADTHVGPHISLEEATRAIAMVRAERPDLVLLGGDYISESPRHAEPAAALLGELVRSAPLGGYAVLGNHDCGERFRDRIVTAALEREGITVLRNASAAVETGRGQLWIAGIDEAIMSQADPDAAFAGVPTGAATIALWHEPDYAAESAQRGAFVQFSGHSHGGQVRLPGIGPLVLPIGGARFVQGWNQAAGMPVYTTRGVGVFMPPVRLNCPPEVTLISLVAPAGDRAAPT